MLKRAFVSMLVLVALIGLSSIALGIAVQKNLDPAIQKTIQEDLGPVAQKAVQLGQEEKEELNQADDEELDQADDEELDQADDEELDQADDEELDQADGEEADSNGRGRDRDHVLQTVVLIGTSKHSWEDAVRNAVFEAGHKMHLKDLSIVKIKKLDAQIIRPHERQPPTKPDNKPKVEIEYSATVEFAFKPEMHHR